MYVHICVPTTYAQKRLIPIILCFSQTQFCIIQYNQLYVLAWLLV